MPQRLKNKINGFVKRVDRRAKDRHDEETPADTNKRGHSVFSVHGLRGRRSSHSSLVAPSLHLPSEPTATIISNATRLFDAQITVHSFSHLLLWYLHYDLMEDPTSSEGMWNTMDRHLLAGWIRLGKEVKTAVPACFKGLSAACDNLQVDFRSASRRLARLSSKEEMRKTERGGYNTADDDLQIASCLTRKLLGDLELALKLRPIPNSMWEGRRMSLIQRINDYIALVGTPVLHEPHSVEPPMDVTKADRRHDIRQAWARLLKLRPPPPTHVYDLATDHPETANGGTIRKTVNGTRLRSASADDPLRRQFDRLEDSITVLNQRLMEIQTNCRQCSVPATTRLTNTTSAPSLDGRDVPQLPPRDNLIRHQHSKTATGVSSRSGRPREEITASPLDFEYKPSKTTSLPEVEMKSPQNGDDIATAREFLIPSQRLKMNNQMQTGLDVDEGSTYNSSECSEEYNQELKCNSPARINPYDDHLSANRKPFTCPRPPTPAPFTTPRSSFRPRLSDWPLPLFSSERDRHDSFDVLVKEYRTLCQYPKSEAGSLESEPRGRSLVRDESRGRKLDDSPKTMPGAWPGEGE